MLSDAEQRRLKEIEASLRADDARFVHRFESARRGSRPGMLGLVGIVLGVIVTVMALVFANVPFAVCGLLGIGTGVGIWAAHRRT